MKRILIVIALVGLGSLQASAQSFPQIHQIQACLEIGNIKGAGDVTCIGEDGHDNGKAGKTFRTGDRIFILVRFRGLPVGKHRLHVFYFLVGRDGQERRKATKDLTFTNRSEGWAYWFPAEFRQTGKWKVIVAEGNLQGVKRYCVNCPGE
jgi:hypothetical protein